MAAHDGRGSHGLSTLGRTDGPDLRAADPSPKIKWKDAGMMHAFGYDIHMSMLIGTARLRR